MSEIQGNTLWLDGECKYYSELARKHNDKLSQMGMQLTDEGVLTAPGTDEVIDFVKDGVIEIYMGGGEGSLVIFTKSKGQYTQYSFQNDGNRWSSSNGMTSEERNTALTTYDIGPNSSRTAVNTLPATLLTALTCPSKEDLGTALGRLKDILKQVSMSELGGSEEIYSESLAKAYKEFATMANSFLAVEGNTIVASQLIDGVNNGIVQEIIQFELNENGVLRLEGKSNRASIDKRDLRSVRFNMAAGK